MTYGMTLDEKLELSEAEKGFRLRQKFMTEISMYVILMISGIILAMNHIMSVNRKREYYIQKYDQLIKDSNAK